MAGPEAKKQDAVDDGFEKLDPGADFEGFIEGDDLKEGAEVHATMLGARLIPDDERGGYRVVFVIALKKGLGSRKAGESVGFGEREKLKPLRALFIGQEFKVKALGKKKLTGGRTMHTFDIFKKPYTVRGAQTVQQYLDTTWKNGGAGDAWSRETAPEPGSEG